MGSAPSVNPVGTSKSHGADGRRLPLREKSVGAVVVPWSNDAMSDIHVTDVDPAVSEQLLDWNALLRDGFNAGREAAWWASGEATLARFESPKQGRCSVLLVASLDGRPAGAAGAEADPGQPAEVEISVLPQFRRRGVGRALARAVRERLTGRAETAQAETYSQAGVEFGRALGMRVGNTEQRLLLDLPVDLQRLRAKHGRARGVEVRSWIGACPGEVLEDWARLTMQMEEDVPIGDLTRPAPRSDLDSVRLDEQRMEEQGWLLVRSIARLAGVSVGYTQMFLSRHDPEIITQDDTLVDRAHRGYGVGRALKLANLENLSAALVAAAASAGHEAAAPRSGPLADRARWIQTYTALDNAPMLELNRAFGFRDADLLAVLEGRIR